MVDAAGKIIYIGKAKNLQNRVKNYFQKNIEDTKTRALVAKVVDFEVILTQSEAEALILESILIKRHKPRYNIQLKDDRSYPYVMVDGKHTFPRLLYIRRPKKMPGRKIIGPFASAFSLRTALRAITKIFRLRDCSDTEFANRSRPCIYHQIGQCSAPCTGLITPDQYQADLERALQVLSGHGKEATENLEAQMSAFSEQMEFEQAGKIRDQLHALQETMERKSKAGGAIERAHKEEIDRDIIGWLRKPDSATIAVLFVRMGNLVDTYVFHFDDLEGKTDEEVLNQFLAQFYLATDKSDPDVFPPGSFSFPGAEAKVVPSEIVVPFETPEFALLQESLLQLGEKVEFILPKKGPKWDIFQLAQKNAENAFDERQREKGSIYRTLAELKAKLRLENYPRRMECFDISNLGDTGIVASRVTFIEGKPDKNLYRKYKLKTVDSQNDFASMKEVIERRLLRSSEYTEEADREDPPDLIIIDGGKGQLAMAAQVMEDLNITGIDLVSLAKAKTVSEEELKEASLEGREVERAFERIFKPGRMNPILLAPDSPVCHLLQRIRDEAHRFAIEFQRSQRKMKF